MNPFEKDLLDQLSHGFLKLDQNLVIVYANAAVLSMLDASTDDLYSMPFPRLTARSGIVFDPVVLHNKAVHVLSMHSFSGKRVFLEFSFSSLVDRKAEFSGYAVLIRDVTGKTWQMEQLTAGMEAYRGRASSCADWFWETDTVGTFTFVSEEVTDHTGYAPEDLFGRTPFEFMSEEEGTRVASLFSRYAASGVPFSNLLNEIITKTGTRRLISTSGTVVFDKDGNLKGYRGCNRDVTGEVESRRRLRRNLEETLEVFNEMPVGLVVIDEDQRILQANRTACNMAGLPAGEISGRISREVFCTDCDGECQTAYGSGKTFHCRSIMTALDGKSIPVLYTTAPLPGSSGQRFLKVITDLSKIENEIDELTASNTTFRKQLQALSESSIKMKAAVSGRRNLHWSIFREAMDALGGVAGYVDIISASAPDDPSLQLLRYHVCGLSEALDSMRNHFDSSAETFTQEEEDFLISSFLEKTLASFRISTAGDGIQLRTEYTESSELKGPVRGIRTILTGLLSLAEPSSEVFLGACETMDGTDLSGLRISITISRFKGDLSEGPEGNPTGNEGNKAILAQCGEYAALLGSELFTEELHNGGIRIWADFPVSAANRGRMNEGELENIRTIVFSEDRTQAELFRSMLEKAGFRTTKVTDPESMKTVFAGCGIDDSENVCLLIDADCCDFNELVSRVPVGEDRPRSGQTRWILVTSRIRSGDVGRFSSAGCSALLLKPVRLGRLTKCISRVFGAPRGSSFTTDYSF